MTGPRDPVERYGVPVNSETGRPLTDAQSGRLEKLANHAEALRDVMHDAEGSSRDDGWDFRSKRMQRAADHLEIGVMMARKAALEAP